MATNRACCHHVLEKCTATCVSNVHLSRLSKISRHSSSEKVCLSIELEKPGLGCHFMVPDFDVQNLTGLQKYRDCTAPNFLRLSALEW